MLPLAQNTRVGFSKSSIVLRARHPSAINNLRISSLAEAIALFNIT
jgi:hypothetical protein